MTIFFNGLQRHLMIEQFRICTENIHQMKTIPQATINDLICVKLFKTRLFFFYISKNLSFNITCEPLFVMKEPLPPIFLFQFDHYT